MISVLIVGDIRLYCDGLAELLDRHERIEVLAAAEDRQRAVELVGTLQPDVVLVDMAMTDGLATASTLSSSYPTLKIVALAVPELEHDIVLCAEAGIVGYVPRQGSLDDLISTLKSVYRGEFRCSPRIAAALLRRVSKLAAERGPDTGGIHLTPREMEVLTLVDRGMTNKDIARRLGIEVATARNHVHNILEKLNVHHRGEAAARMRNRLPQRGLEQGPKSTTPLT